MKSQHMWWRVEGYCTSQNGSNDAFIIVIFYLRLNLFSHIFFRNQLRTYNNEILCEEWCANKRSCSSSEFFFSRYSQLFYHLLRIFILINRKSIMKERGGMGFARGRYFLKSNFKLRNLKLKIKLLEIFFFENRNYLKKF